MDLGRETRAIRTASHSVFQVMGAGIGSEEVGETEREFTIRLQFAVESVIFEGD